MTLLVCPSHFLFFHHVFFFLFWLQRHDDSFTIKQCVLPPNRTSVRTARSAAVCDVSQNILICVHVAHVSFLWIPRDTQAETSCISQSSPMSDFKVAACSVQAIHYQVTGRTHVFAEVLYNKTWTDVQMLVTVKEF